MTHTPVTDNHRGDRRDSSAAAGCEQWEHFQALHTPRGVRGGEWPSGHAAQRREEEQPSQVCAGPAAHQGLAGGMRVEAEGGHGQASLPARHIRSQHEFSGQAPEGHQGYLAIQEVSVVEAAHRSSAWVGEPLHEEGMLVYSQGQPLHGESGPQARLPWRIPLLRAEPADV